MSVVCIMVMFVHGFCHLELLGYRAAGAHLTAGIEDLRHVVTCASRTRILIARREAVVEAEERRAALT